MLDSCFIALSSEASPSAALATIFSGSGDSAGGAALSSSALATSGISISASEAASADGTGSTGNCFTVISGPPRANCTSQCGQDRAGRVEGSTSLMARESWAHGCVGETSRGAIARAPRGRTASESDWNQCARRLAERPSACVSAAPLRSSPTLNAASSRSAYSLASESPKTAPGNSSSSLAAPTGSRSGPSPLFRSAESNRCFSRLGSSSSIRIPSTTASSYCSMERETIAIGFPRRTTASPRIGSGSDWRYSGSRGYGGLIGSSRGSRFQRSGSSFAVSGSRSGSNSSASRRAKSATARDLPPPRETIRNPTATGRFSGMELQAASKSSGSVRWPMTSRRNSSVQDPDAPAERDSVPALGVPTEVRGDRISINRMVPPIANQSGITLDQFVSSSFAGNKMPIARGAGSDPSIAAAIASESCASSAPIGIRTSNRIGASTSETVSPVSRSQPSDKNSPGAALRAASRTSFSRRSTVRTCTA